MHKKIAEFLDTIHPTNEQQAYSVGYLWCSAAWARQGFGNTYALKALCWYHHIHKTKSREWRPAIIVHAMKNHIKTRGT
jgi:hypothetical protein